MHPPFRSVFLIGIVSLFAILALPQSLPSNVNYSTLFGGSREDRIAAIATDTDGNIWVAGTTRSPDLPGTVAEQERHVPNSDSEGFVAKIAPGGDLLFAHYLGGYADDEARSIAIDPNGNAFVVGTTSSPEFPAYESGAPPWRAFVAYISADGEVIRPQRLPAKAANAIVAYVDSEFWVAGESENAPHAWVAKIRNPGQGYIEVVNPQEFGSAEDRALAIAVDASGNCYVTGETKSIDFPTTTGAPQATLAGSKDAFLIKLALDGTLLFSTYFGFSDTETSGHAVTFGDGNAYIAGTSKTGYDANAFVAKYSATTLVSSQWVGGSGTDEGNGIALDNAGFPVLVGTTNSPDFIAPFNCPYGPCSDAFMLTLDTPGISSRIGGQETSEATSILRDAYGNLFTAGMTRSPFWPVTDNALQQPEQGDNGFLIRFAVESVAPATQCDDPATGTWSKVDVEVACSASDSLGSGLANPADSSFSLKTSIPSDTQTNDAKTDSRKVCDHAGNCETAGPYTGLWIDKKAPTIVINLKSSYALHETATADYSCDDQNGSGVKSCIGPVVPGGSLDTSTAGTKTFNVAAIDNVGNEDGESFTYEVVADSTAPVVRCAQPDQIWHKDPVTIACTAEDTGSGLLVPAEATFLLTATPVAGVETQNAQTDTRSICDKAGNCATAGPISNIHMDTKAPVLTRSGLLALAPTWSATDVSVQYTATDDGSGLAIIADAIFSIFTSVASGSELAGAATNSHTVCDNLGNCAIAGPEYFNVDKKAPSITILVPNSQKYFLNQTVSPNYSCVDNGSGIATCNSPAGNKVPTGIIGQANFVVNATDKVGHAASQTTTYEIIYKLRLGYDPEKESKGGSFPFKLQLTDMNGANRSATSIVLTVVGVTNIATGATVQATGTFRYDRKLLDSGGYILNLDTSGLTAGSYALLFKAGSNANLYSAPFRIR